MCNQLTPHKRDCSWIFKIKKGDVLRSGSGDLRVVRAVKIGKCHGKYYVTLAIRHCSWTRRCYTVLSGCDLLSRGFRPTRAKVALKNRIDKAINTELQRNPHEPRGLTCCDVEGVP